MTAQEIKDTIKSGNRVYFDDSRVVLTQFGDELVVMRESGQQFFCEKIHGSQCYAVEVPSFPRITGQYQNMITGEWEEYKC